MSSLMQGDGKRPVKALALALGIWAFSGPPAGADDGYAGTGPCHGGLMCAGNHAGPCASGVGTLGYGPPGLYPGFQGFGLGYHLGYGYGGSALGVGADGGYPFYGGPGYPNGEPPLRRCRKIVPFAYFGGPGYPTPDHPNFFGATGPLVGDRPVVTTGDEREPASGYGVFTGTLPYPDSYFAPFSSEAASSRSPRGTGSAPSTTNPPPAAGSNPPSAPVPPDAGAVNRSPARGRTLGIDAEPVVDGDGVRGMKVSRVYPGTAAEKAGLHAGDVIRSINGYLIQQSDNLTWVLANGAANEDLVMNVRAMSDGKEQRITAKLR